MDRPVLAIRRLEGRLWAFSVEYPPGEPLGPVVLNDSAVHALITELATPKYPGSWARIEGQNYQDAGVDKEKP